MARTTSKTRSMQDPTLIAEALNAGQEIDGGIATFVHTFTTKSGVVFEAKECPIVLKCSQSGRYNPVARIENGEYVEDTTFVGRDRTATKTGFYRIDKQADKENQSAWRAKRAEALAAAQEAGVVDEALNVVEQDDAPEAKPARKRAPRKATPKVA